MSCYPYISIPFPTFLICFSYPKPKAQVPCLAELRKKAEFLSSSSSKITNTNYSQREIKFPEKVTSKGLPIPISIPKFTFTSYSTHTFQSSNSCHLLSFDMIPRKEDEEDKVKESINSDDIEYGFDQIYRLGKKPNKLYKLNSNEGYDIIKYDLQKDITEIQLTPKINSFSIKSNYYKRDIQYNEAKNEIRHDSTDPDLSWPSW
ncbi:uncharacterized protein I206_107569 [Kwoniella pini CBS 10737]|uniref:Uncharacterized protein n=1 Tax=Kwoniella pini CBS 10737 TaxID=1296096 RepID=A0A1B9HXM7_9TREE|nr:uncharacterized protein I206_05902 [Kwoniella pini CBS 10737]OCF48035.1 hypothetical protein I206_05902 [Kwoniella pini CBS 10737]